MAHKIGRVMLGNWTVSKDNKVQLKNIHTMQGKQSISVGWTNFSLFN